MDVLTVWSSDNDVATNVTGAESPNSASARITVVWTTAPLPVLLPHYTNWQNVNQEIAYGKRCLIPDGPGLPADLTQQKYAYCHDKHTCQNTQNHKVLLAI